MTLLANVALDRVNGGPWVAGGCPTFAPLAFSRARAAGEIITACAPEDRGFFSGLAQAEPPVSVIFLDATRTVRFSLDYSGGYGEQRSLFLHGAGHVWSPADVGALRINSQWVHLAPLLRDDFPVEAVARLAASGHRLSFDGQGLVRTSQRGPLILDGQFDPALLHHLTVLKLSEDELEVLAAGRTRQEVLAQLAPVPELLITAGPLGVEVRVGGAVEYVKPSNLVADVQTTGAGDAFMIG